MNLNEIFEDIYNIAKQDKAVRERLIAVYRSNDAIENFCEYAAELGFVITPGDIITAGEEYSCNQLKSTNGGGVNPYDFFDDPFDMFMVSIESIR